MHKLDYIKEVFKAGLHTKRNWVFSAFTVIQEDINAWKRDPFTYRIVQTPSGVFYVRPDNKQLEALEGITKGQAPFHFMEGIDLKAKEFENVNTDMRVSIGNLFFNLCAIIPAFGSKMPFVTGNVNIGKLENEIAKKLKDTPMPGETRQKDAYYVDEYLKFCDSFLYLTEFTQICTWALTEKAITQAPGTIELRNKLVEENKDNLTDPLVVAKIEAELLKHDAEYLKGDPSENFLISKKSRNTARKKLFLDYGADPGLTATFEVDMVQKSLSEGWDTSKMPTMINALRAGSFNRGAETQLGGEAVKWLYRASSNINILDQDCGSRIGLAVTVDEYNKNKLINKRIITQNSTKLIKDEAEANTYLGKRLMVRSPLYCKLPKTDYCRYCLGENLGVNPNAGSTAISKLGSVFMSLSLKAFHSTSLVVTSTTIDEILS